MFVDSHCHLDFPELRDELPQLLDAMRANAVTHALCIAVDTPDWPAVHALAAGYPNLYATVGVHPDYADTPEPTVQLRDIGRLLRPGGRIALVSQPRCPGATGATSAAIADKLAARLSDAGFEDPRIETLDLDPPAVCVLATHPRGD